MSTGKVGSKSDSYALVRIKIWCLYISETWLDNMGVWVFSHQGKVKCRTQSSQYCKLLLLTRGRPFDWLCQFSEQGEFKFWFTRHSGCFIRDFRSFQGLAPGIDAFSDSISQDCSPLKGPYDVKLG